MQELSKKGRFECRLVLSGHGGDEREKQLETVLNMHTSSLAKTVILQGKILDEYVQKLEKLEKDRRSPYISFSSMAQTPLADATKDKRWFDQQISGFIEREKALNANFGQTVDNIHEQLAECKDPPAANRRAQMVSTMSTFV